jgi:hypothetical protein
MADLFDETEQGLTRTALTLYNTNSGQGLTFGNWGSPEREKINRALEATNLISIVPL